MISFDFEYYRPSTLEEAVNAFSVLDSQGKCPTYYGGGTEIITRSRLNQIHTGAVIDIKEIPQCRSLEFKEGMLSIGSALTLSSIREANLFPLLSDVIRRASDHTSRNKITLGGNICSALPYRETVLPFLLCDSEIVMASPQGLRYMKITDVFNESLKLQKGEFIIQLRTEESYLSLPYEYIKKTKQDNVDYPLLGIAALIKDNLIRIAFSGLCPFPFRAARIEQELNNINTCLEDRIDKAVGNLPVPILADIRGSAEYREFVFRKALYDLINRIGVMQ